MDENEFFAKIKFINSSEKKNLNKRKLSLNLSSRDWVLDTQNNKKNIKLFYSNKLIIFNYIR